MTTLTHAWVQVMDIKTACAYLRSEQGLAGSELPIRWSDSIYATQNFVSIAAGQGARAMHVRMADNMLLFMDGSVLLLSEREAEHILLAVRAMHVDSLAACLVNLAMCRWSTPTQGHGWGPVPLSVGRLPSSATESPSLLRSIVCVQLFNGETKMESGRTTDAATDDHRAAVMDTVFGVDGQQVSAEQGRDAAKQLVELRSRGRCWQDSDLELLCTREVNKAEGRHSQGGLLHDCARG